MILVEISKALGTALHFSIAFHLQIDGQFKKTSQTLKDILRAYVLEFKGSWVLYLSLVKFAYNNNYQVSIGMAPYEALYGRMCRTPLCWDEVDERKLEDIELIKATSKKIKIIRSRLKVAQDQQKSYADNRRRVLEFEVGDMTFLKVDYWKCVI